MYGGRRALYADLLSPCYPAGFVFYALQIPERWLPGWFDLLLSSHQIWHIFVWLAGAAWLHGMVEYHGWAVENHTCPGNPL